VIRPASPFVRQYNQQSRSLGGVFLPKNLGTGNL